jgi:hypothetical protein
VTVIAIVIVHLVALLVAGLLALVAALVTTLLARMIVVIVTGTMTATDVILGTALAALTHGKLILPEPEEELYGLTDTVTVIVIVTAKKTAMIVVRMVPTEMIARVS